MIPYQDFVRLLTDTTEFDSFDAYVAECGGSIDNSDLPRAIRALKLIWTIGHEGVTVASLMEAGDIKKMSTFCREYGLPYRTVQNWALDERKPSEWQMLLLAYAVFSNQQ